MNFLKGIKISLSGKQQIFTRNIASLIVYADMLEIKLTFGDAFRNEFTQKEYVRLGLSKTMNSYHRKRLAVDFNFFINGKLTYEKHKIAELGAFWEKLHPDNRWGGNFVGFVDSPHFQMND
jgi:hypothetical protein